MKTESTQWAAQVESEEVTAIRDLERQGQTDTGHAWPTVDRAAQAAEGLEIARTLARDTSPAAQAAACHLLAEVLNPSQTHVAEALEILVAIVERQEHLHVEWAVADAARFIFDARAFPLLARLSTSRSSNVRWKVCEGLPHCMQADGSIIPQAVDMLLAMNNDPSSEVREWSTLGLGSQIDWDTPRIRDALYVRLADSDAVVRAEAAIGLARRGVKDIRTAVEADLARDQVAPELLDAAALLQDRDLLPRLQALRDRPDVDRERLERAIASTQGAP